MKEVYMHKKQTKRCAALLLWAALFAALAMTGCPQPTDSEQPTLAGTVIINGTPRVGETLSANTAALEGTGALSYRWQRGDTENSAFADVANAEGATYIPADADLGKYLRVHAARVGYDGTITSPPHGPILASTLPPLSGTVSIDGTAQVGETLSANTAALEGSGAIAYRWQRGDSAEGAFADINEEGANETYVPVDADLDKYLRVRTTRAGHSGAVTSPPLGPVTASDLPSLSGTVSVSGTAQVGQTLSVNTAGLKGTGAITHQWQRGSSQDSGFADIANATGGTYTLTNDDLGAWLRVTVRRVGHSGTVNSASLGPVTPQPVPLSFSFEALPLVKDDNNKGGETAGILTGIGGTGPYVWAWAEESAFSAKFRIEGNELKIAGTAAAILPVGSYPLWIRVTDSKGASWDAETPCVVEVSSAPAKISGLKSYSWIAYTGAGNTPVNRIILTWNRSVGATGYRIYAQEEGTANPGTLLYDFTEVTNQADRRYELSSYSGGPFLPSKTYRVWLQAYNAEGWTSLSGPEATATARTSEPVQEWWHTQDGKNIVRLDSDTDAYWIGSERPELIGYGAGRTGAGGTGYKGVLRNHIKFDPAEAAQVQPYTLLGKWGENLTGSASGVFIIEYLRPGMKDYTTTENGHPGDSKQPAGYEFFGLYYWGAGIPFQPANPNGVWELAHINMTEMYLSNSWPVATMLGRTPRQESTPAQCNYATYEQAMNNFTLELMNDWIAFIATPWYPVFDNMAVIYHTGNYCPHNRVMEISGKDIGGDNYEYTFINNFSGNLTVAFDLEGKTLDEYEITALYARQFAVSAGATVTKPSDKPSIKFAFSGRDDWHTLDNATGTVTFTNGP
jgi:hypothetical protein